MRAAVLLIFLIIAWTHAAVADEANEQWQIPPEFLPIDLSALPPRPEGNGWRRIANFPGATDSTCIGSLHTPLCAIETLIAGRLRWDPGLANVASAPYGVHDATSVDGTRRPEIFDIRIIHEGAARCTVLNQMKIDARCVRAQRMVVFQYHECGLFPANTPWLCYPVHPKARIVYYLNRNGGMWKVVYFQRARY
jgi:hypothetical protein